MHSQALRQPYVSTSKRSSSSSSSSGRKAAVCCAQRNYYAVLKIPEDSAQDSIRAAFRSRAKLVHPDVNKSPDADKQFRLLKRAHDVLLDSQLRSVHDAELGLASARSRDPRFARFYRWRSEVLPDLEAQLDVWTAEVAGVIADAERQLSAQQVLLTALLQPHNRPEQAGVGVMPGLPCDAAAAAAAAAVGGAGTTPSLLQQNWQKQGRYASPQQQQQQQENIAECDMDEQQQHTAAQLALSSMQEQLSDALANVQRLYEKRYQQVEGRYAYPAIVWYDMWTEISDGWLNMAVSLEAKWQPELDVAAAAVERCWGSVQTDTTPPQSL